jgi:UDP-glucose 4-epimerase
LEAARRAKVRRVIYAASSSAYGDQPQALKRETDAPAPLSPYAAAKLAGESYCRAFCASYGLETVCLRYFNVFGPRQDAASPYGAVIPLFIGALLAGRPPVIYGDGLQSRDFCYVANAVRANLLAAEAQNVAGWVLNIGTGRCTSLLRLLEILNRLLGRGLAPVFAPARSGDIRHSLADISQARQRLGYEPTVSLEEGLSRTIAAIGL